MSKPKLGPGTRVQQTEGHLESLVGTDTVVLHGSSGVYYGIKGAGTLIWNATTKPEAVEALVGRVVAEYDVEPATASAHVVAFLCDLAEAGLVRILEP